MSDITNPAAGAAVFTINNGHIRFGVLSSVGVGYEIGDVVNLVTEVDNTIKFFTNGISGDNPQLNIRPVNTNLSASQNVANVLADVNAIIADINTFMGNLQKDGYFKAFASLHAPTMPLIVSHEAFSGSFVFDVNKSNVALASFLSDDIGQLFPTTAIFLQVQAAEGGAELRLGDVISSDTAVVVKGTSVTELSLGYSLSKWQSNEGQLFAGIRTNFYKVELTRAAQLIDSSTNESLKSIFDNNKDSDLIDSTGFGVDLGVLWVSEHYRGGATLKNINKPSFDFNAVDTSVFTDPVILEELQKMINMK
ncbi:MAG: conjugal transfer protein TraF [Gammaproteobacteria bacterium]|nr:conjugal transfer protein TraF [Gammaproteobacteria bacterium]